MFIGKTYTAKGKKAYSTTEIRKIGVVKTKGNGGQTCIHAKLRI